jgi:glycogen synthase
MRNTSGGIGWNNRIKRALVSRVKNVAISQAIAQDIGAPGEIMGNPYDETVFKPLPDVPRDRDIIFVGRLVSDKGADLLLRALALLKRWGGAEARPSESNGSRANLTIAGQGPAEQNLRQLAAELKLDVTFAGAKSGAELASLLNRHQIIAIPSRWPEPFGVVALEGIACGCVPVGSEQGGLKEAIGNCGPTFPNGDVEQLGNHLQQLLIDPLLREKFRSAAPTHLARFRAPVVADRYLELLSVIPSGAQRSRGLPAHRF